MSLSSSQPALTLLKKSLRIVDMHRQISYSHNVIRENYDIKLTKDRTLSPCYRTLLSQEFDPFFGGIMFFKIQVFNIWSQSLRAMITENEVHIEYVYNNIDNITGVLELESHWIDGEEVSLPDFCTDGKELETIIGDLLERFPHPNYMVIARPVVSYEKARSHVGVR